MRAGLSRAPATRGHTENSPSVSRTPGTPSCSARPGRAAARKCRDRRWPPIHHQRKDVSPTTLYARSDVMSVSLSAAHGGCGKTHSRPVEHGAPVHPWALDCSACENHLRASDPHWSPTVSEIPETPDETKAREDLTKRSERSSADLTALMLARLAGDAGAEMTIQQLMGMRAGAEGSPSLCPEGHKNPPTAKFCTECGQQVTPAGMVRCPDGHESPAGSKFCVECGQTTASAPQKAVEAPAQSETPAPPAAAPGPSTPAGKAQGRQRLRDMRLEDLQALARERGLPPGGTRAELIGRLKGA